MTYTLNTMQRLIEDANTRMRPFHQHWDSLGDLLTTGMLRELTPTDLRRAYAPAYVGRIARTINILLPQMTLIENSLVQNDPVFLVYGKAAMMYYDATTPEEFEDIESKAAVSKSVVTALWEIGGATQEFASATRDSGRYGPGFVKIYWSSVLDKYVKDPEEYKKDVAEAINKEEQEAMEEGRSMKTLKHLKSMISNEGERYVENRCVYAYVNPRNIRVPIDARRMKDTDWVAERTVIRKDKVEDNPAYKAYFDKGKSALAMGSYGVNIHDGSEDSPYRDSVFDYCEVWEFWDFLERKLYHFQLDSDECLFDGPIPWQHNRVPYIEERNYCANEDDFWTFGELDNLAGVQIMMGETVRSIVKDIRTAGNKVFLNQDYITPAVKEGLSSPESNLVIPIKFKSNNDTWERIMNTVPSTPMNDRLWSFTDVLQGYGRTISGISDFQAGSTGADRVSGTAAAEVAGNSTVRLQARAKAVDDALAEAALQTLLLAQEHMDEEFAIRVGGQRAGEWLKAKKDDLQGEFNVAIKSGSTSTMNPAALAQRGQTLLNLMGTIQPFVNDPGMRPILEAAMRDMGFNPDSLLPPLTPVQPAPAPEQAPAPGPALGQLPQGPPETGLPGETGHPIDVMTALGGPPVPAATSGDIAL